MIFDRTIYRHPSYEPKEKSKMKAIAKAAATVAFFIALIPVAVVFAGWFAIKVLQIMIALDV